MKILIVHSEVSKNSGSGRYIYDISTALAEQGHTIILLAYNVDPSLHDFCNISVIQVKRCSSLPLLWRFRYLFDLISLRKQAKKLINEDDFKVLVGSDLLFIYTVMKLFGNKKLLIYTPLSMIAPLEIKSYGFKGTYNWVSVAVYRYLQKWALVHCDRVVRFTPSALQALERYYNLPLEKKALNCVYVSKEFESEEKTTLTVTPRNHTRGILWVGRLIKSKNVDFLIRAVAKLKSNDWVLNICSDGPEKESLVDLSRSLGIYDRVRFHGFVEDVSTMYEQSAMLVTASVLEQYSLIVMEAYQHSIPCIGLRPDWKTIYNSNEDQILNGKTGFVVSDEQEMAEKIDYLLVHEEERRTLGRNGYLFKQDNYSFDIYFKQFCHLLEEV